jgi:hypothetical protein
MRCRQPKILYTIFAVESVNSSHQKNLAAAIQTKRDIESRQNIMRDIIIATYHFTHYQDMITNQPTKSFRPTRRVFSWETALYSVLRNLDGPIDRPLFQISLNCEYVKSHSASNRCISITNSKICLVRQRIRPIVNRWMS